MHQPNLHIDPDEIFQFVRVTNNLVCQLKTSLTGSTFRPSLGYFTGERGVDRLLFVDRIEEGQPVSGAGAPRLIEIVDMFAQDIERRSYSALVQ